jgi:hypothetical protein
LARPARYFILHLYIRRRAPGGAPAALRGGAISVGTHELCPLAARAGRRAPFGGRRPALLLPAALG